MSTAPAFLHPFARPARPADEYVTITGGAGAEVWDRDGRRFIDGMASLWYCNVGYGRVEIADAVHAQLCRLAAFSCFDPFTNEPADELAELIAGLAPTPESRVFFTSSGSEAVDSAIKLARIAQVQAGHPERSLILSRARAYHGVTYGGMTAQGLPLNREGFGPYVAGMVNLPADDLEAWARYMAEHGPEVAAILTEPVQGAGGVYPPPEGYLAGLRRLADQHGCYLIFDEVICGFGRLGRWFGAEHFGIEADLTTFAKAVTSGYVPLGGVLVAPSVRGPLEADEAWLLRHGHTYSGHPTACAAGLANVALLREEGLVERASVVGQRLFAGFRAIAQDGRLAEVRSEGAVGAIKLTEEHDAFAVRDSLMAAGVITRAVNNETLTWCPPLVITDAQVDQVVDAVAAALD
ncbi:MAG TPA: aminotransferase class III-fold pyridoxal phosphate-dependent enzyme [Acidimicrobiales bacterium]|nr:aminotransferase class III-fold pyridoxal phosphate-dependent enzyme [Acidimicrobiales bacterium]